MHKLTNQEEGTKYLKHQIKKQLEKQFDSESMRIGYELKKTSKSYIFNNPDPISYDISEFRLAKVFNRLLEDRKAGEDAEVY